MINRYLSYDSYTSLNEIGDASAKPFKWKEVSKMKMLVKATIKPTQYGGASFYKATSPSSGLEYTIQFLEVSDYDDYMLVFAMLDHPDFHEPYAVDVNAGDMYGLLATIIEIADEFIKKREPRTIIFSGAPSKDEVETMDTDLTKRTKLYLIFLKKQLGKKYPRATFSMQGNSVYIKF